MSRVGNHILDHVSLSLLPAAVAPAASHPSRGMTSASAVLRPARGVQHWLQGVAPGGAGWALAGCLLGGAGGYVYMQRGFVFPILHRRTRSPTSASK